jgi:hypothetical protein
VHTAAELLAQTAEPAPWEARMIVAVVLALGLLVLTGIALANRDSGGDQ